MDIPIYVINMKSSQRRWELVQAAGKEADLNLFRVDAIDGKSIPKEEWENIDQEEFTLNTARDIFPGEYGCYRSHMLALERFVVSDEEYGIILEDDILPNAEMFERVKSIIDACDDFDVVKLVNHRASGFITLATTCKGDDIGRTIFSPQGSAAAYLVSKAGAKLLLKSLKKMRIPWDIALENSWEVGANVLTVKDNLFNFSEERSSSNIAPNGYGNKKSFSSYLRRGIHIAPAPFRRFQYASLGPKKQLILANQHPTDLSPSLKDMVLVGLGILVMLSVFWIETDAYRYACFALLIPSFYFYLRYGFWRYDKPHIGLPGILCIFWALFVGVRFLHVIVFYPEQGVGSSEGIYLFPMIYPTLGYVMWRFCRKPFLLIISFIGLSLIALSISTDYESLAEGVRASTFTHNNTIHAANAAGFLLIFATCFTYQNFIASDLTNRAKILIICACITLCTIALINVLILTSKGVWLALAIVLPFILICFTFPRRNTHVGKFAFGSAFLLISGLLFSSFMYWYSEKLFMEASDSYETITFFLNQLSDGKSIVISIQNVINSSHVSTTALPRLLMWLDVLKIWSENTIFGVGVSWSDAWEDRTYSNHLPFNIFHNSFMEIGIRYGLAGLAFFGFIFLWAANSVYKAAKHQIITPAAAICYFASIMFFFLSGLTNSIIRLAIGESFMLLAVGFGFYCSFRLQEKNVIRPRTWL